VAGEWDGNSKRNRQFFSANAITPAGSRIAIDIGAGCNFQSILLAEAGFKGIAVDFCKHMLDIMVQHAGALPVRPIQADILSFESWAGKNLNLSPAWEIPSRIFRTMTQSGVSSASTHQNSPAAIK
jgi:hypothetical protein